ncbi:MAG TPA: nitroreductase family deazaflavin-dependent oxidoreductase [Jatrophihabitans sp.]|uniref:nitroreductase family deazaflavin-dependent oxidoreductase n=1 Tax=Jatrophihabitans sp. TaxID=1932789 RepID=UPI002E0C154C|nr:nitroreductase family deazaflavin-dependent oxidoreductase [Jatrophihabitans sp.]
MPEPRTFHMTTARRFGNRVLGPLIRLGVVPGTYVLTVPGRRSGKPRSTPVTLVDGRYLVAPYGPVDWVRNVRAAPTVTLSRRGRAVEYTVREVSADEAGPVLKRYVALAKVTRPYFRAAPDAPPAEFAAEADRHPVFELIRP